MDYDVRMMTKNEKAGHGPETFSMKILTQGRQWRERREMKMRREKGEKRQWRERREI